MDTNDHLAYVMMTYAQCSFHTLSTLSPLTASDDFTIDGIIWITLNLTPSNM